MERKIRYAIMPFVWGMLTLGFAQSGALERQIKWGSIQTASGQGSGKQQFTYFEGANYEALQNLPQYLEVLPLTEGTVKAVAQIDHPQYEKVPAGELQYIQGNKLIKAEIQVSSKICWEKKSPFIQVSFVPFRQNADGSYERLVSFALSISTEKKAGSLFKSSANKTSNVTNSVLATGTWYKIAVTKNGVHKIDRAFLKHIGIDVATLDPKNIRIYGNGGGMIPIANWEKRHEDLNENAILVFGENDGKLDSTDYILFYAEGPHEWKYDTTDSLFRHAKNHYSDSNYYFITTDLGPGKRIAQQNSASLFPTHTVNTFDDYDFRENDNINLIKSGIEWYGEYFDVKVDHDFSFNFASVDVNAPASLYTSLISRGQNTSFYQVDVGNSSSTIAVPPVAIGCFYCSYAAPSSQSFSFSPTGDNILAKVTKVSADAIGWMDFMEINVRRNLIVPTDKYQFQFRDIKSVGPAHVANYSISSNYSITIWDITESFNIKMQQYLGGNNNYNFILPADSMREFAVFTDNSYYFPVFSRKVDNQNLHHLPQSQLIVVSHPEFIKQALELAEIHKERDTLSYVLVTPEQIYNEFSSGRPDVSAIRDFVRMFYDRATKPSELPSYLLLYGDGSYDNKGTINNTNFIPTYESDNSLEPTGTYVSDDFFGLLDTMEGGWLGVNDLLDIGIGRLPVKNVSESIAVLEKIKRYIKTGTTAEDNICVACPDGTQTSSFGDWRNGICFIADDEDSGLHQSQADQLATMVNTKAPEYNVDKIYLDAFVQESVPGGERYPTVNEAFNNKVQKGALIINYTGHGGELGLAGESILTIEQVNNWTNPNNHPLFFTATCEFSRFDDPSRTSAGELVLLNPNGGGIALMTTVRLVYATPNFKLNQDFYNYVFKPYNGKIPAMGDVFMLTKRASGSSINSRNFTLLGDPALKLVYPYHKIKTSMINNDTAVVTGQDTARALSKVTVTGYVTDKNGNKLSNYNGILYPTVYDKSQVYSTLSNDGPSNSPVMNFNLQKNMLFKGKVSIHNGDFSFSFIVPKDINYSFGKGKISYYATDGNLDANGYFDNMIIGGANTSAPADNTGPQVRLYMNDEKFVNGGVTNENPMLLAVLKDQNGINTVGNGIGHDIVAVLDKNTDHSIVLNDYYRADLDSFNSGKVSYPFSALSEGIHTLSFKAWDIYNNSTSDYTEFVVAKSVRIALKHVLNYPNPFTTHTQFFFEHNQSCEKLDVQVQIFTVAGKLVKTITTSAYADGFRVAPIDWDGKDDFENRLGRGVYVYRVRVKGSDGSSADEFQKLVILN